MLFCQAQVFVCIQLVLFHGKQRTHSSHHSNSVHIFSCTTLPACRHKSVLPTVMLTAACSDMKLIHQASTQFFVMHRNQTFACGFLMKPQSFMDRPCFSLSPGDCFHVFFISSSLQLLKKRDIGVWQCYIYDIFTNLQHPHGHWHLWALLGNSSYHNNPQGNHTCSLTYRALIWHNLFVMFFKIYLREYKTRACFHTLWK